MHQRGLGLPTQLTFRGTGYALVGNIAEPNPKRVQDAAQQTTWIHAGDVRISQRIRITDANKFHLYLEVFAQVCDATTCHELRAVVETDGKQRGFKEFAGRFEDLPVVRR